jgi:RHS repeat-associated protein
MSESGGMSVNCLTAGGQNAATDVKGNITTLPGNLRPTGATTAMNLTWDSDNKLRSADIDANGTADVNFQYDALGRRVARSGTGGSVVYVQMDQQTIADYPVGGAATTPTVRYVYASYIDEPVVRKTAGTGGTLVYFHRNHQYSVTAVTTSTGAIAERYAYSAYGQPTILDPSGITLPTSNFSIRSSYTGREWDATVGLHHFRARWMSPKTGRFLGRDPIGFVGGQFSVYAYVGASPLRYVDPLGLQAGDPDPSIPFLFGNPLGDFLQGNITGVCYEVLWKVDIKLLDVNYFGGGNAIWLVLRPYFDRSITGGGRRMCADCCMISMTDIDFKGTRSFILQDVVVSSWFQPDPGVKIGISGSIIINLGVCVKPGCKCPPSIKRKESIDFGDLDLGTIKYSDLMKRIPK